jgi:hypothetical protein
VIPYVVTNPEEAVARRINLTRDERIVLGSYISGATFTMLDSRVDQITKKLIARGLIENGEPTSEGRRAMAEARQTKPKVS